MISNRKLYCFRSGSSSFWLTQTSTFLLVLQYMKVSLLWLWSWNMPMEENFLTTLILSQKILMEIQPDWVKENRDSCFGSWYLPSSICTRYEGYISVDATIEEIIFCHSELHSDSEKPRFFKKAQPTGFWVYFYWVLGFIGFFGFLFERAVGKLVGWFSLSAKLLFRFTSTYYLQIRKFITYWSLEAVNIKKSLISTGMTN